MLLTIDVSKLNSRKVVKLAHPENIKDISSIKDVLKLSKTIDFKFVHPKNNFFIFEALEVSKLDIFNKINEEQF
jgi:hypothetical protein